MKYDDHAENTRRMLCLALFSRASLLSSSPTRQGQQHAPGYIIPFVNLFSLSSKLSRLFHLHGAGRLKMITMNFTRRKRRPTNYCASCLFSLLLVSSAAGQYLSDATIGLVTGRLAENANASWEIGTRAQSLIELDAPLYSVLSLRTPQPPSPQTQSRFTQNLTTLAPVFNIARTVVANRSVSNGNLTGPQPLMKDGSAADPASIGPAVVLTAFLGQGQDNGTVDYWGAANDQLEFLLQRVPRTKDGAISHRVSEVQLWSDFVYMVPPFLAYYGIATKNQSLVYEAYNQIRLYRNYLRDPSANNLWKHIVLGSFGDNGYWSTGNGWAAAGMLRVLATIQNSQYDRMMVDEQVDLASWVQEIHNGMYPYLDKQTNMFPNYAARPISTTSNPPNFYDASSTALLASTVYRLSLLWGVYRHLPDAERSRLALFNASSSFNATVPFSATTTISFNISSVSPSPSPSPSNSTAQASSTTSNSTSTPDPTSTSNSTAIPTPTENQILDHIDSVGWLHPVVNPYDFRQPGSNSPEGQAFVLQLHSAWRDWVADGAKGANGAARIGAGATTAMTVCCTLLWFIWNLSALWPV